MPARVFVAAANLYAKPDKTSPLETQMLFGETFLIEEEKEGWAFGKSQTDGYQGFILSAELNKEPAAKATHMVSAARSCVYPSPDVKTLPSLLLPLGAQLVAEETSAGFLKTKEGFVPNPHLKPIGERGGDFVDYALLLLGTPYIWGGRDSTSGLDCSALCQLALGLAGISAPRNSGEQEELLGKPLAADETPKRGDFVFWNAHVGILTDENTLLHANAHHMAAAQEPLAEALARIKKSEGEPRAIKRL